MSDYPDIKVLEGIKFPNSNWRLKSKSTGALIGKNNVLVAINRMRKAGMEIPEVQSTIADLYFDAFGEHELQIREVLGKTAKEAMQIRMQVEAETAAVVLPRAENTSTTDCKI